MTGCGVSSLLCRQWELFEAFLSRGGLLIKAIFKEEESNSGV